MLASFLQEQVARWRAFDARLIADGNSAKGRSSSAGQKDSLP